jgi:hypothetical protein
MMVGIFAEGRGDLAVITNILKGSINIDRSDIRYELPEFDKDQTDLSMMAEGQFSSWTVVKTVCQERYKIDNFFNTPIEQELFIVLHLDTAERHLEEYNVLEPVKNPALDSKEYCNQLRNNIIDKVNEWLENLYPGEIAYAIAIEETDAWVLTIYDKGNIDTSAYQDPKKRLNDELNRVLSQKEKNILRAKVFDKYDQLSSDFRKKRKLSICMSKNESLKLFCESLEAFRTIVEIPEST